MCKQVGSRKRCLGQTRRGGGEVAAALQKHHAKRLRLPPCCPLLICTPLSQPQRKRADMQCVAAPQQQALARSQAAHSAAFRCRVSGFRARCVGSRWPPATGASPQSRACSGHSQLPHDRGPIAVVWERRRLCGCGCREHSAGCRPPPLTATALLHPPQVPQQALRLTPARHATSPHRK